MRLRLPVQLLALGIKLVGFSSRVVSRGRLGGQGWPSPPFLPPIGPLKQKLVTYVAQFGTKILGGDHHFSSKEVDYF